MKKNMGILIIVFIFSVCVLISIVASIGVRHKTFSNSDFSIKYDTTWKVVEEKEGLELKHKRSKAILNIQTKVLDDNYYATDLKDIIDDILYSIEKQNSGYSLINTLESPSDKYDSYSYLYEDHSTQAMVNIYKLDSKVIIVYYEANNEYFDIVLDSVEGILDSLVINVGERIS